MNPSKANHSAGDRKAGTLIYVVDDEPVLLELASVILEPLGYEVETFRDAQSALTAFASAKPRPTLIITDFSMHATSGLALIEACRKIQPRQKVLLVSGTVDERVYEDSAPKPNQFLAKPYNVKQLEEAVKTLLGD
jgi:DNA-binding NtrC family response regulator